MTLLGLRSPCTHPASCITPTLCATWTIACTTCTHSDTPEFKLQQQGPSCALFYSHTEAPRPERLRPQTNGEGEEGVATQRQEGARSW